MMNCSKCKASHCNNISLCDKCIAAMEVQVGHVEVTKAFEYDKSFESPTQYHAIMVEPGTYPIIVGVSRFDWSRYVVVRFSGKVTASGYGSKAYPERVGTMDTVSATPYKYTLREGDFHGKVTLTDLETFEKARGL